MNTIRQLKKTVKILSIALIGFTFHMSVNTMAPVSSGKLHAHNNELVMAANRGDKERVMSLLQRGADKNAVNAHGTSALSVAASRGYHSIVQLLLEQDAEIQTRDNDGMTALLWAAHSGSVESVSLLLEAGADKEERDNDGMTPLLWAMHQNHRAVILWLLKAGVNTEISLPNGSTPLIDATNKGYTDLVKKLLKKGASPKARDKNGNTALLLAAYKGYKEIAEVLLQYGADINEYNKNGATPLLCALDNQHEEIALMLVKRRPSIEKRIAGNNNLIPLPYAAYRGYGEIVALLLEQGAPLEDRNQDGNTPLICAAIQGHTKIVDLLLPKRANIEASNNDGDTALNLAAFEGHREVCELLIHQGSCIETRDKSGFTPLMSAALGGKHSIVELLIAHNALIKAQTPCGYTSWNAALSVQQYYLARILESPLSDYALARKALHAHAIDDLRAFIEKCHLSIEETDRNGVSLLAAAAAEDKNKIVVYLLSKNANPFLKTKKGWTPLRLALNNNPDSLSAKMLQRVMEKREKEATDCAKKLDKEETEAQVKEAARRKKIALLLSTSRCVDSAEENDDQENENELWTDADDCDAHYLAQCIKAWQKESAQSTPKKVSKKKGLASRPTVSIDVCRTHYDDRVREWFENPDAALERPEYVRCPETFFPEIIFRHTVARSIDALTPEWAIYDTIGINKKTALMYCVVMRYGRREDAILEYGIDTRAAHSILYHRFLNKIDKHPHIGLRFMVPMHVMPSEKRRMRGTRLAVDESYIVQITPEYVELYDPNNDATIFVCKPRR